MSGPVGDNTARASGVIASAGGGTILSAKSLEFTGTASRTGTTPAQISSFDMSFAPTESDSKLFFEAYLTCSTSSSSQNLGFYFYDVTNSAIVGAIGDAAGSRQRVAWAALADNQYYHNSNSFGTWHEPGTTTSRDYTIFGASNASSTLYINRNGSNADNADMENCRASSIFTIYEYAADAVTLT